MLFQGQWFHRYFNQFLFIVDRFLPGFDNTFRYDNVYLSLGSNIDDKRKNLNCAINQLNLLPAIQIKKTSHFYISEPLYMKNQPDFINCTLMVSTNLEPVDFLRECLHVEEKLGRIRKQKYEPRLIDIDLIFFGEKVVNDPLLQIPHPKYSERKFVLLPMIEISPEFQCPVSGLTMLELLKMCPDDTTVTRINEVELV